MTETTEQPELPSLQDMQHWTWVFGKAQQMLLEHALAAGSAPTPALPALFDPGAMLSANAKFWDDSLAMWQRFLAPPSDAAEPAKPNRDKRFAAADWSENPAFDLIRQSYLLISDHLLRATDAVTGVDEKTRDQMRFATQNMVDALSPSNFALTNPVVLKKTIETGGANLLKGLEHMLADIGKGQLTHTDPGAFELGRNIAMTPGKVVHETPLYQLIQYDPVTPQVMKTPLVIFPPWINRYYILDLNPEKSFIRWAVEQGVTVFIVSWKSADASTNDVVWDDYVKAQIDAFDTVRAGLDVPSVHAIGYCVAGTTLAATLSLLAERGQADKVESATFFTAQVDFAAAGDLQLFIDENHLKLIDRLSADGFLDGRYMALTFNLLRGRDLIWNYVVNNYLLGEDYPPFDLLFWNGDTTNLPAKWHRSYLTDLYRDNRLIEPGALSVDGVPIDLTRVKTPSYIQAGREDHIAPAASVWKMTQHFKGPMRFVLAGSGHIAGVVNPPAQKKYQYWTGANPGASFEEFVSSASETKGSWWPDWVNWLRAFGDAAVPATGARIPGQGPLGSIEPAPGRYVKER